MRRTWAEEAQEFGDALVRLFHALFPWFVSLMNWLEARLEALEKLLQKEP